MSELKAIKEPLMKHLFENAPLNPEAVETLLRFADDCMEDLPKLPDDAVKVALPNTNVGSILIQKEFAPVAEKIDELCDRLYRIDDWHAGWEYFSTICYAVDCAFTTL